MGSRPTVPELYIHWNITRECNFTCDYCVVKATRGHAETLDVDRVVERLDRLNKTALISFSGGEPFLVQNFVDLASALTQKHLLRLDTNLAVRKPCEQFLRTIDPQRVTEICFSAHVIDRERRRRGMQELCVLVNAFQDRGFKMIGNYVAWPQLMSRIERDLEYFMSEGLSVYPTPFWGMHAGRTYPMQNGSISYSSSEWNFILSRNPAAVTQLQDIKHTYCQAGSRAFAVTEKLEVIPCDGISTPLGGFFGEWRTFEKVIRCPLTHCTCPVNRPPGIAGADGPHPNTIMLTNAIADLGTYSVPASYKAVDGTRWRRVGRMARKALQKLGM